MASRADITLDQGSTFELSFSVKDDENLPLDLTGYTARAQIRKHYSSANAVSFTTAISNNEIVLTLTAAETANVAAGRWVYDCEIVDASNVVTRVIEGVLTVAPEVTR